MMQQTNEITILAEELSDRKTTQEGSESTETPCSLPTIPRQAITVAAANMRQKVKQMPQNTALADLYKELMDWLEATDEKA